MKFRMYVDESGTHNYPKSNNDWERALGLTGVIISQEEYDSVLQPRLKTIKKLFTDDLDNLPVLHRDDISKKIGVFKKLQDESFRTDFNQQILQLLKDLKFTICCVVIDKKDHKDTYNSPTHPYYYCFQLLLERYSGFLNKEKAIGDVLAESRGGIEDLELKTVYESFYDKGNSYRPRDLVQKVLTSRELKMKKKTEKIEGLELVDLLAIPTKLDVLATYRKTVLKENFNKNIIDVIQSKYHTSSGPIIQTKGYGKKIV